MWAGLNMLVRRNAVREGNAEQILSHWKMDMLSFWTKGHYKYFIIGHQLLAGTAGYLPESLRQDLTWNRLANLSGKKGNNTGLNLVNEFLNNDFKEMLKVSRGQYTNKQVDRCAQVGGAFGKKIDKRFTLSGLGSLQTLAVNKRPTYHESIEASTKEFYKDALFDHLP